MEHYIKTFGEFLNESEILNTTAWILPNGDVDYFTGTHANRLLDVIHTVNIKYIPYKEFLTNIISNIGNDKISEIFNKNFIRFNFEQSNLLYFECSWNFHTKQLINNYINDLDNNIKWKELEIIDNSKNIDINMTNKEFEENDFKVYNR